jgi:hypothetical protein
MQLFQAPLLLLLTFLWSSSHSNTGRTHAFVHHNPTTTIASSSTVPTATSSTRLYQLRRFLGKGERAIVRNGVVLVAPAEEYHHFYRQAGVFIYTMGEDEVGEYVVRGLIVDHPTPFTLREMIDNKGIPLENNPLGETLVFRGGDKGGEGVVLLHTRKDLGQSEIGSSGLYQGGWEAALEACAQGKAKPEEFKIFFNYCEFTEKELESMLTLDEEGDGSVEVNPDFVLNPDWNRGAAWARLRNAQCSAAIHRERELNCMYSLVFTCY